MFFSNLVISPSVVRKYVCPCNLFSIEAKNSWQNASWQSFSTSTNHCACRSLARHDIWQKINHTTNSWNPMVYRLLLLIRLCFYLNIIHHNRRKSAFLLCDKSLLYSDYFMYNAHRYVKFWMAMILHNRPNTRFTCERPSAKSGATAWLSGAAFCVHLTIPVQGLGKAGATALEVLQPIFPPAFPSPLQPAR